MIIMNQAAGEEEARPTVGYRQDVPRIPSRDFFILSRVSYYRWLENHLDDNRGLEGHSDNNPGFPFRDCLEYHSDNKLGVPFTDVLENYLDDNIGAPFANVLENQSELGSSRVPEIFLESVRLSQRHSWKLTKLAVDVGVEDCIKRNIFKAFEPILCYIHLHLCRGKASIEQPVQQLLDKVLVPTKQGHRVHGQTTFSLWVLRLEDFL